jgi:hypothetical protein
MPTHYLYLVLRGKHEVRRRDGTTRVYRPGQIFETSTNLLDGYDPDKPLPMRLPGRVSPPHELYKLLATRED